MKGLGKAIKAAIVALIKAAAALVRISSDMIRGIMEIMGSMFTTLFTTLSEMLEGINKSMKK